MVTASRRTDVPAFYSRWLLRRLDEGFCHVANPVSGRIQRVALDPEEVAALGLFTRDPRPMTGALEGLRQRGYAIYTHVTVNGYPERFEPRAPEAGQAVRAVRELAEVLGQGAVVWRYDPVVLGGGFDQEYHRRRFAYLAQALEGAVRECYISFVDPYRKTARNVRAAGVEGVEYRLGPRHLALASLLVSLAEERGIRVRGCTEPALVGAGVAKGACVDAELVERLRPGFRPRPRPTREGCGCADAVDIGAYHTCGYGCVYCYATDRPDVGVGRLREHDSDDTILWRPPELRGLDLDEMLRATAGEQGRLF